jgi:hypothetical protein
VHWNAVSLIPDAIISDPDELIPVLRAYERYLPDLESALASGGEHHSKRFDRSNYFIPQSLGGTNKPYPVYALGRHFAGYECLQYRVQWHELTRSVHDHKDADEFPSEWVESIYKFILDHYPTLGFGGQLRITIIPARPGRMPRLTHLLEQIEERVSGTVFARRIVFLPDLLGYRDGVVSNSRDHLSRDDRFVNIRDHLYVRQPEMIREGNQILVLDDVVTSGSTLVYAKEYIEAVNRCVVTCLALAKNISRVI